MHFPYSLVVFDLDGTLVDSASDGPGGVYTESGVADAPLVAGHELRGRLLAR